MSNSRRNKTVASQVSQEEGHSLGVAVDTEVTPKQTTRRGRKRKAFEDEYCVEKILDKRYNDGQLEYLIKWKDYETDDNSWEPVKNIFAKNLIRDYEKRVKEMEEDEKYIDASDSTVASILGKSRIDGMLHFVVEYHDGTRYILHAQFVIQNLPLRLMEFLQKHGVTINSEEPTLELCWPSQPYETVDHNSVLMGMEQPQQNENYYGYQYY